MLTESPYGAPLVSEELLKELAWLGSCVLQELSHSTVMAGRLETKYKHGKRCEAPRVNDIFAKSLNCVLGRGSCH